jgi:peptidyl-prolyl cis-trans isomerase C
MNDAKRHDDITGRRGLAVAALCAALALGAVSSAGAQEVGTAARVNGTDISVFRLERHFEDYLKLQARNVAAIRHPDVFRRLKREALDQLIDVELLWQEAQRRKIEIPASAVATAREKVESGYKDRDAFTRRLRDAGFDEQSYDAYLARDLAARRALGELVGAIEVSDAEVRRVLAEEPPPPDMADEEARRQVRGYLTARSHAESSRAALKALRAAAEIELQQGL